MAPESTALVPAPPRVRPGVPWPRDWTVEGIVALLEPLVLEQRQEKLRSVAAQRLSSVTVVMDAPHDPHNAAAILRSCEAFGVGEAHVVLRSERFRTSRAVARGTERWVSLHVHRAPASAIGSLRRSDMRLVAAHPEGRLLPADLASIARVAVLVGNEHDGIRHELRTAADDTVRIPMRGFVESLNVSVAAALLLEAATRGRAGDLNEEQRRAFYARGLYLSVPRAREVLAASAPR